MMAAAIRPGSGGTPSIAKGEVQLSSVGNRVRVLLPPTPADIGMEEGLCSKSGALGRRIQQFSPVKKRTRIMMTGTI